MILRWLYFILLALLLRMLWRSLAEALRIPPGSRVAGRRGERSVVHRGAMVRDPICGLHVPESRALVEHRGGERFYFCSEGCASAFRRAGV